MHQVAEFGVVALGSPLQPGAEPAEAADGAGPDELDGTDPARPGWLSRLLEWQQETPDPDAFWSTLTAELSDDGEITAVTEEGATLVLPVGASCVDAAYQLGEQIGHRCIGARINGRLAALATPLRDGDVLGILTEQENVPGPDAEPSGPSPDWLEYAHTPGARIAIERWLAEHPQLPPGPSRPVGRPADQPALAGPEAQPAAEAQPAVRPGGGRSRLLIAPGHSGATVRLARCCTPIPPDEVTGFRIRGGSIAVHRADCPSGERMRGAGRGAVQLDWAPAPAPRPIAGRVSG